MIANVLVWVANCPLLPPQKKSKSSWTQKRALVPRLRSRSKSPLIRPSQKSGTSDQTVPDRNDIWSDECALEDRCALEVRSNPPLIRLECARNSLWSDWRALYIAYDQSKVRSKSPLIRQKCARNHLWSEKSALEITSNQTKVRSKLPLFRLKCAQNSPIREWFWTSTNLSISL